MDIVVGAGSNHCIVTLAERVTGATLIGRLRCRKVVDVNRRVIELIEAHRDLFITITVDNGPEFHGYKEIEAATGVKIFISRIRMLPGNAAPTRTPTDSFVSTCLSEHP